MENFTFCAVKIGDSLSESGGIIAELPDKDLPLDPYFLASLQMTLFYIFKNLDFCKYADDSTLYSSGESLSIIIENLKANFLRIFKFYGSQPR